MASIYSYLSSGGITESSSPLSASLLVLVNIFPTSHFVNVNILPVPPLKDVAQDVYITAGRITVAYGKGYDIYANALEKYFHQKQHHTKILSSLYLVRTQDILFDDVEFQQRHCKILFVLGDTYLTSLSKRVQ